MEKLDRGLSMVAAVLALAAVFYLFFIGLFTDIVDAPTLIFVGASILLSGLWVLLLKVICRFVAGAHWSAQRTKDSKAHLKTVFLSSVGGVILIVGTWQVFHVYAQRPVYQETFTNATTSSPLL